MITFKSDLTETELMHGMRQHYRTISGQKWLVPLCGIFLIFLFGGMIIEDPSDTSNYFFCAVGVLTLLIPVWQVPLIKRNIRRMPNLGKTITWAMDEKTLSGQAEGFEFSQDWSNVYSTTITADGFLVYPQKNLFYWLPSHGFASVEDLQKASGIINRNVKNTKLVKEPSYN